MFRLQCQSKGPLRHAGSSIAAALKMKTDSRPVNIRGFRPFKSQYEISGYQQHRRNANLDFPFHHVHVRQPPKLSLVNDAKHVAASATLIFLALTEGRTLL